MMLFHPGMRVRIAQQENEQPPVIADIIEVVTPELVEDLHDPAVPPGKVRAHMSKAGIAAALILKGPSGTFVVECMNSGEFRAFLSQHPVTVEILPAEMKTEVQ